MSDALAEFLQPFPVGVSDRVRAAREAGAFVALPEEAPVEFRRDPAAHLRVLDERLDAAWRAAAGPGTAVWCLRGSRAHGLDDFEASAVLGRRMAIDLADQVTVDDERRVVVVGTLREEAVAVAFRVDDSATDTEMAQAFVTLADAPVRAAVVFVSARVAERMAAGAAASALRRYLEAGGALGLRVPADAVDDALRSPETQTAFVDRAVGRPPLFAHFDALPQDASALDTFMRRAGLVCDTSVPVDEGAAAPGRLAREAAWAGASPYRPQPFDLFVPWFHPDEAPWFELPMARVSPPALEAWWRRRRDGPDLAPLLDGTRMEAFYRASRIDPALERTYPDFRVYNWPAPPPATRVTLIDGGTITSDGGRAALVAVDALVSGAGPRVSVVSGAALADAARREMSARYHVSPTRAIEAQNEAHEYLATVPQQAPLRVDYADFSRFVAADLGDALELGSGYGVLAWALSLRARRYTCLDLDHHMFAALRPDLGQAGLVADTHRLPFSDDTFDTVVANNVLEHLYDPLVGLSEIRRVLRPGGRVFAMVPLDALNSHHALPAHLWKLDAPKEVGSAMRREVQSL
ncbi:MAG: class I SAM-dependent methyltransferase, partial [Vicinamibacteria bacterium]